MHKTIVESLSDWIKNLVHLDDIDASFVKFTHGQFFAFKTGPNELCLAEVEKHDLRESDLKREVSGERYIRITAPYKSHHTKKYSKIRYGRYMYEYVHFSQLILLPVPISTPPWSWRKWIITNKIFNDAKKLCFEALFYAKKGDWKSFALLKFRNINIEHFYFFKGWSILDQAIAHRQMSFIFQYLEIFRDFHRRNAKTLCKTAAIYGNQRFFKQARWSVCKTTSYETCVHLAICHEHHGLLKWFLQVASGYIGVTTAISSRKVDRKRTMRAVRYVSELSNILGSAIKYNDLKAVQIIVEWNKHLLAPMKMFEVDSVVWAGNTALQTALMMCNDNFDMIEYLLVNHDPNYDERKVLKQVDPDDPYLVYREETKRKPHVTEEGTEYEYYTVTHRHKLKGPITNKPDTEGYTIDERINHFESCKAMTVKQCRKLRHILQIVRSGELSEKITMQRFCESKIPSEDIIRAPLPMDEHSSSDQKSVSSSQSDSETENGSESGSESVSEYGTENGTESETEKESASGSESGSESGTEKEKESDASGSASDASGAQSEDESESGSVNS